MCKIYNFIDIVKMPVYKVVESSKNWWKNNESDNLLIVKVDFLFVKIYWKPHPWVFCD